MNVRDPFNLRSFDRNAVPATGTWKSIKNYRRPNNNNNHQLSALQHIVRTAAAATQSAATDLRDKAGEVVQSAQHALSEAATAAALIDDREPPLDNAEEPGHQQRFRGNNQRSSNRNSNSNNTGPQDPDMSFAVPKNVPSFSNPQRHLEDRLWAAAAASSSSSPSSSRQRPAGGGTTSSGVLGGVQDLLSARSGNHNRGGALPMYKDKPYGYPPGGGRARRPLFRRKRTCGLLLLVIVAGLVWWTGLFAGHHRRERAAARLNRLGAWLGREEEGNGPSARSKVDWLRRRERVVEAMELSWDAYERYAWGGYTVFRVGF